MSNKYDSIDICKFFMAVCVIAAHTLPFYGRSNPIVNELFENVIKCAVPFFFMATGFFLTLKSGWPCNSEEAVLNIRKYCKKVIKLYIIWSIIYLPLAIFLYVSEDYTLLKSVVVYFKNLVLLGEHYNSYMLWYLLSTIYAIGFYAILLKKKFTPYHLVIIGSFLFCVLLIIDNFVTKSNLSPLGEKIQFVIIKTIGTGRLLYGFFYIPIGMILTKLINVKISHSLTLFILLFVLSCIIGDYYLKNIVIAVRNVVLFIVVKDLCLNATSHTMFRKMSTYVYFFHMYIWTFCYGLLYQQKTYGMRCFVITLVVTTILSYLYIKLKDKYKDNKLLRLV